MYQYYFVFRSVTAAQHGLVVLREHGIRSALVQMPAGQHFEGCGFALKVSTAAAHIAAARLRQSMISFRRVLKSADGIRFEEVVL